MEHKTSDDASVLDIMHFSIDGKYIARMSVIYMPDCHCHYMSVAANNGK